MGKGKGSSGETEANHISSGQKENRGGTKGTVGEAEGGEEKIGGFNASTKCVVAAEVVGEIATLQQQACGLPVIRVGKSHNARPLAVERRLEEMPSSLYGTGLPICSIQFWFLQANNSLAGGCCL